MPRIVPPWQEPFLEQVDRELHDGAVLDAYLAAQLEGIHARRAHLRSQISDLETTTRVVSAHGISGLFSKIPQTRPK